VLIVRSPTPTISWKKISGTLPHPRFTLSSSNSAATITNLEFSDAGIYECEGAVANLPVTSQFKIRLVVEGR